MIPIFYTSDAHLDKYVSWVVKTTIVENPKIIKKKKKRKTHKPNSNRESMLGIREIYSLFLNNLQNFVTANCYNINSRFFAGDSFSALSVHHQRYRSSGSNIWKLFVIAMYKCKVAMLRFFFYKLNICVICNFFLFLFICFDVLILKSTVLNCLWSYS